MHADIKGALEQINTSWKAFEHRGKRLSKEQVTKVLKYGLSKGYKTTNQLSDEEVDIVLNINDTVSYKESFNPDWQGNPDDPSRWRGW